MILIVYIVFIVGVLVALGWLQQRLNHWRLAKEFEKVFKSQPSDADIENWIELYVADL